MQLLLLSCARMLKYEGSIHHGMMHGTGRAVFVDDEVVEMNELRLEDLVSPFFVLVVVGLLAVGSLWFAMCVMTHGVGYPRLAVSRALELHAITGRCR